LIHLNSEIKTGFSFNLKAVLRNLSRRFQSISLHRPPRHHHHHRRRRQQQQQLNQDRRRHSSIVNPAIS